MSRESEWVTVREHKAIAGHRSTDAWTLVVKWLHNKEYEETGLFNRGRPVYRIRRAASYRVKGVLMMPGNSTTHKDRPGPDSKVKNYTGLYRMVERQHEQIHAIHNMMSAMYEDMYNISYELNEMNKQQPKPIEEGAEL